MKIAVHPSRLSGIIPGIASKSCLHRLLLCAALSSGETVIESVTMSKDIYATISAVSGLGKGVSAENGTLTVYDTKRADTVNVNESGSTFRFLLPVAAAYANGRTVTINGSDYLASRPISPLYEELVAHGAVISEKGRFPMTVGGKLSGGVYRLPGDVSSQFVSGLLLALPLCKGESRIVIEGKLQSKPYVDITVECLRLFGISVTETDDGYVVPGDQKYISPGRVRCEADYSNAAFFLTAGALSESFVGVSGLKKNTTQGDAEIISLLSRFGAEPISSDDAVAFKKATLSATEIDATDIPDLIPIVSLIASVSEGVTTVSGAERLRYKESDRLRSVCELLTRLGGNVTETDDGLIIKGVPSLSGGEISSYNDHRIVMTAAIASLVSKNDVIINGAEAVSKSYPLFFEDFAALGGSCTVIEE